MKDIRKLGKTSLKVVIGGMFVGASLLAPSILDDQDNNEDFQPLNLESSEADSSTEEVNSRLESSKIVEEISEDSSDGDVERHLYSC
jgi:hypothetical protein